VNQTGTPLREKQVHAGERTFLLRLEEEDLGGFYPGMVRYSVRLLEEEKLLALFRTNTYEYTPMMACGAREAAERAFFRWEEDLGSDPAGFLGSLSIREPATPHPLPHAPAVVIIQGSPRPGGNSFVLASWVADEVKRLGRDVSVFFPQEMEIHPCIGCYQCYNTGACIYDDEMAGVISAVEGCTLLVVCTPVYTNSVPAMTKALLDRFQALHAKRTLVKTPPVKTRGILISVAGRKGKENFACVSSVVSAFFSLIGIRGRDPLLIDGTDEIRDIRTIAGLEERAREAVRAALAGDPAPSPGR